ncbi:hypothetical protein NL676_038375 [Syzygium grande]|nr:hypothetical protein NL676_038375 [Syzygium grande]
MTKTVPKEIRNMLLEYEFVMQDKLPKELPLSISESYDTELLPGAKSPTRAPYKMAHVEMAKQRKQPDELMEVHFIYPSKASNGIPVLP